MVRQSDFTWPYGKEPEQGFSLIELLIALALVGILLTAAVSGGSGHLQRMVTHEGAMALLEWSTLQRRLYQTSGRYHAEAKLEALHPLPPKVAQHYRLGVDLNPSGSRYTLKLLPIDPGSGYDILTLDQAGRRTPASVWP